MTYENLKQKLLIAGYERVERDDRLLDVFPSETKAKGVELWVRFNEETVDVVRVRLPYKEGSVTKHQLPHSEVELALAEYQTLKL